MARFSRSCAHGIFAALMFACLVAVSPALAETMLRIANLAEPETLDPHKVSAYAQAHITRNLFEGLVVLDPKGNVAPGVAETWSVSEDGLSYRFRLVSVAKGKIVWQNRHFQRFLAASFACQCEARCLSFER